MYNTSYIFIPVQYTDKEKFSVAGQHRKPNGSKLNSLFWRVCETLYSESREADVFWEPVHMEFKYILKYVADKVAGGGGKPCQCFRCRLNEAGRSRFGLGTESDWFVTEAHTYDGEETRFRFQIISVQLFCFTTSVCVAAFQIRFDETDPFRISTAQYYMKKVSRERIAPEQNLSRDRSMLEIAETVLKDVETVCDLNFFYYVVPGGSRRANVFTCLEAESKEDYREELYYLRRCYRKDGYPFIEDRKSEEKEILQVSGDVVWGITSEASVCLTCPEMGNREFLENTFYRNFNVEYLMLFVLLLHQKYVLYMFLTQIGDYAYHKLEGFDIHSKDLDKSLKELENYQYQLYKFETDFVFTQITEVPQYQNVYNKMSEAFALREMYDDVHEPLISLSELRRQQSKHLKSKQDEKTGAALAMLSILVIFSALIDSFDFAESFFGEFLGPAGIWIIQIICIAAIAVIAVYSVKIFFSSRESSKGDKIE